MHKNIIHGSYTDRYIYNNESIIIMKRISNSKDKEVLFSDYVNFNTQGDAADFYKNYCE